MMILSVTNGSLLICIPYKATAAQKKKFNPYKHLAVQKKPGGCTNKDVANLTKLMCSNNAPTTASPAAAITLTLQINLLMKSRDVLTL